MAQPASRERRFLICCHQDDKHCWHSAIGTARSTTRAASHLASKWYMQAVVPRRTASESEHTQCHEGSGAIACRGRLTCCAAKGCPAVRRYCTASAGCEGAPGGGAYLLSAAGSAGCTAPSCASSDCSLYTCDGTVVEKHTRPHPRMYMQTRRMVACGWKEVQDLLQSCVHFLLWLRHC